MGAQGWRPVRCTDQFRLDVVQDEETLEAINVLRDWDGEMAQQEKVLAANLITFGSWEPIR